MSKVETLPAQLSLEDQVSKMSKTALGEMLENEFGYKAEPGVLKEKLQKTILQLHKKRVDESKTQTEKATESLDGPVVRVLFQHLDGDQELKFPYDGGKGFKKDKKTGKIKPLKTFHLINGQQYDLPLSVVDHLNNIAVPDVRTVPGVDGQITTIPIRRKRFSCEIILTPAQRKALSA
jgi:hypothetical protein